MKRIRWILKKKTGAVTPTRAVPDRARVCSQVDLHRRAHDPETAANVHFQFSGLNLAPELSRHASHRHVPTARDSIAASPASTLLGAADDTMDARRGTFKETVPSVLEVLGAISCMLKSEISHRCEVTHLH